MAMNAAANTLENNMQSPPTGIQAGIANPSLQKEGADSSGDKMKVSRRFLSPFDEVHVFVRLFVDARELPRDDRPSSGRVR